MIIRDHLIVFFLICFGTNGELLINKYSREFCADLKAMIMDRGNNNIDNPTIINKFAEYARLLNENYPYESYELPQKSAGTWIYRRILITTKNTDIIFKRFATTLRTTNRATFEKLIVDIEYYLNEREDMDKNFFDKYSKNITGLIENCKLHSTEQQTYYRFYLALILNDLKQLLLHQFRYLFRFEADKQPHYALANEDHKKYKKNIETEISRIIKNSSNQYSKCNLPYYGENTFLQIKGFLQGEVLYEMDLDSDGSCKNTCSHYKRSRVYGCHAGKLCDTKKQCKGIIRDCQKKYKNPYLCTSHTSSYRRYYKVSENKLDNCYGAQYYLEEPSSDCNTCFCICDESNKITKNSLKMINMRASLANVYKNRIVTGVRFVNSNDMLHLQVQEGELMKQGLINKNTISWVPIENYTIFDDNIHESQDYLILRYERRSIDLNDIIAGNDFAVIGVRFKNQNNRISLEVKFSPFDFDTGKLKDPYFNSFWKDNAKKVWKEIEINKKVLPTNCRTDVVREKNNGFVKFDVTSWDEDAAQTIVPFIDVQPLTLSYPMPLSGVGISYRYQENCTGFIKPKIFTYNSYNKN